MPDLIAAKPAPGAPVESTWGGQVHDAIEGIQTGNVSLTFSTTEVVQTITFPRAYKTPPIVFTNCGSTQVQSAARNQTETTVLIAAIRVLGTASTTQKIDWIAFGELA